LGGLSLLLGYKVKSGSILLILFLIPATLVFHNPIAEPNEINDFLKNLGLISGLLMVIYSGAGALSIDSRQESKTKELDVRDRVTLCFKNHHRNCHQHHHHLQKETKILVYEVKIMAKRLTFDEFRIAIEQRTMPLEKLPDYVDFDPQSPVPKLVFRVDALLEPPHPGYDVDAEIYRMLRVIEEEREAQRSAFSFVAQKQVVAEGDSWFNLPWLIRPPAIADWIQRNGRFRMKNIAYWGHTLERILRDKEYISTIATVEPEYFIFSAGGNDLQLGLAAGTYIHAYDPARSVENYLTEEGEAAIARIENSYRNLLDELSQQFDKLKVICYGYDYPRPLVRGGTYIGRYLRNKGIPDELMGPIMVSVLDQLNEAIQRATQSTNARYLDCRRVTEPYTWYDDMHPDRDGFLALSIRFEEEMNR
jgi:hypothetical protein